MPSQTVHTWPDKMNTSLCKRKNFNSVNSPFAVMHEIDPKKHQHTFDTKAYTTRWQEIHSKYGKKIFSPYTKVHIGHSTCCIRL